MKKIFAYPLLFVLMTSSVVYAEDGWRSDMSVFVKEVDRVFADCVKPPESTWKGNSWGLKIAGSITLYKDDTPTGGILPINSGINNECGHNLAKRFETGDIAWTGKVIEARIDEKNGMHYVFIAFPPPAGAYDINPLTLSIPFSKLPRERAPKEGALFAFSAKLKGHKDDVRYRETVNVIYWFAAAPLEPKSKRILVLVSATDASPSAR